MWLHDSTFAGAGAVAGPVRPCILVCFKDNLLPVCVCAIVAIALDILVTAGHKEHLLIRVVLLLLLPHPIVSQRFICPCRASKILN